MARQRKSQAEHDPAEIRPSHDPAQHTATKRRGGEEQSLQTPRKGDAFHCKSCGMALEITADCGCTHPEAVHLQCCGQEMAQVH